MNVLLRWFDRLLARRQVAEIQSLLAVLASLDKRGMSELVVVVADARNQMASNGVNLLHPFTLVITHPKMAHSLARSVEQFRKEGNQVSAGAFLVWTHTMRAAVRPSLLPLAKQMWRELSRGFDGAQEAALEFQMRGVRGIDLNYFDQFPVGFDPNF